MITFKKYLLESENIEEIEESEEEDKIQRNKTVEFWKILQYNIYHILYKKDKEDVSNNFYYEIDTTKKYNGLYPIISLTFSAKDQRIIFKVDDTYNGYIKHNEVGINFKYNPDYSSSMDEAKQKLAKEIITNSIIKEILFHEYIHALDFKKKGMGAKALETYIHPDETNPGNNSDYFNQPIEYNAYYQSAVILIDDALLFMPTNETKKILNSFDSFYGFVKPYFNSLFFKAMTDKTEEKVLKRLRRYFQEKTNENV